MAARQEGEEERCRQLLGELLEAAWPDGGRRRADALIAQFGSLPAVLSAPAPALGRCAGGGKKLADFILSLRAAILHCLRLQVGEGPLLGTSQALVDYLRAGMAWSQDEEFRVLYLNARNALLREERLATGTPNEVSIHPRMVMKRALELGATALILVHNHPSGSPEPSQGDIETTARIVRAAATLDIAVHDHIIVASGGWRSFRQLGLLI